MTMISSAAGQPASQTSGQVSPAGLARLLGGWATGFVTYWARREAIKVLGEMDDRALRDIGIARSQIEAAVGGALNPGMARLS
jgi:uncharacterized protein YjiS (DUF1127 family)